MTIDAHVHVWDPRRFRYDWLSGDHALNRPFLPADIDRGSGSVQSMIFVQADCAADQGVDEARWVASLTEEWPELAGIVAFASVEDGARVASQLDELADVDLVCGIRRLLQGRPDDFFESSALVDGLNAVGDAGLSFDACVTHGQLPALRRLRAKVPGLTVILDHLGKPPVIDGFTSDAGLAWREDIRELATFPETYLKLSGMAPESSAGRPLGDQVRPFLLAAVEAFGTRRCMVGSDWPVSARVPIDRSYGSWFEILKETLTLDAAEEERVFSGTAGEAYRL
jgi:L-fuconolactonase